MFNVICKQRSRTRKYYIFFPFDKDFIELIKSLDYSTRKWEPTQKAWELTAISLYELIKLHKGCKNIFFDFEGEDNKQKFIENYKKDISDIKKREERLEYVKKKQESAKELKKYLAENYHIVDYTKYLKEGIVPYPHQIVGAKFSNEIGSAIISADMGCGKTLISLLACEMKGYKKVLVIVPNSLKLNWRNEVKMFTNSKYFILHKDYFKKNIYSLEESKYIITNYEYFRSSGFKEKEGLVKYGLKKEEIDCIVCDEAHRLKNTKSNTSKNITKIFKKTVENFLLLSGTIMPNKLQELYVALNLILPEEFPNKSDFYEKYCGLKYDFDEGWVSNGVDPDLEGMFNKLDGIMYRVKKKDVIKDLPEMAISKINIGLTKQQQKQYDAIEEDMENVDWDINDVKAQNHPLTILGKLRKFTSDIKSGEYLEEFIKNLNDQGEKVVIFDIYTENLKNLAEKFKDNSAYYGGSVSVEERQNLVDRFQDRNSDLMNLFITQQTGKEGITLTAASKMILISQSYVPGENEQTYARIHRIGTVGNVNIYIFVVENSIDENVYYMNIEKQKTISKVIDNEEYTDKNKKSLIGNLLNEYKNKYNKR